MWLVCKEGATGGLLTREGPVSVKQQGGGGVSGHLSTQAVGWTWRVQGTHNIWWALDLDRLGVYQMTRWASFFEA